MLNKNTLKFLAQLTVHNNKEWFEANRTMYEDAKADFLAFINKIINGHAKKDADLAPLEAKSCVYRQNRDVRFSKNKAPYKNNMGAYMAKGGKKSLFAGYYFHLEPGKSFTGGGLWMPEATELKKLRQEIDYNFDEFKSIVSSKKFTSVFGKLSEDKEYKLSRPPKDYEAENPAIEFLKLKSYLALTPLTDADLLDKGLEKKILASFEALQPLIIFLNKAVEG